MSGIKEINIINNYNKPNINNENNIIWRLLRRNY